LNELEFILGTLAAAARELMALHAHRPAAVAKGGEGDFVTQADLAIQDFIERRLTAAHPREHLVAEESGRTGFPADPDGRCWVLDPIDGTHNFIRGLFPVFGISLACVEHQRALAGAIALPAAGRIFWALRGGGAFWAELPQGDQAPTAEALLAAARPLAVTAEADVSRADVEVDFARLNVRAKGVDGFRRLLLAAHEVLSTRSAVASFCALAAGGLEAYVHPALYVWDYAAGELIVAEAGGAVTRMDGSPVRLFDGRRDILATNGAVHKAALHLLAQP
jgi:fructose-1,6-bisphosphatase/inositol monophosphatase family enzyme